MMHDKKREKKRILTIIIAIAYKILPSEKKQVVLVRVKKDFSCYLLVTTVDKK